jgi:NAD-dependent dihydropyrimidine dehydrogenase PreA subunit
VDVCPENCLSLVPLRDLFVSEDIKQRLTNEAPFHELQLQHLAPSDLPCPEGSMMVKDETICIRCGLCAERCPAHTITMEAYEVFEGADDSEEVRVRREG